jgi:hypothetical protein
VLRFFSHRRILTTHLLVPSEMAASFFLLGGSLRDAINVCVRNLNDLSLGVALARLYEGGTDGPVFRNLLRRDVLQEAVSTNNRWLANWALNMLEEKNLALEVLCVSRQCRASEKKCIHSFVSCRLATM